VKRLFKCEEAFILHYVVCGFDWWYKKYQILDVFPNFWFGGQLKIQPCFHLDSRDIYLSGNKEKMKEFYKSQVVLADGNELQRQIDSGMCLRITQPATILVNKYPNKKPTESKKSSPSSPIATEPTIQTKHKPKDGPASTVNTLSLEKMWVISSLVGQYLNQDYYSKQQINNDDNKK